MMTLACASTACDRGEKEPADTSIPEVEGLDADQKDFGKQPLTVSPDSPSSPASTRGSSSPATRPVRPVASGKTPAPITPSAEVTVPPGLLTVAGKQVSLPPARLTLLPGGIVNLLADSDNPEGNVLTLQMTPVTDGSRPWERAEWLFKLSNSEQETTDGLYIGGVDNQLRPLELRVKIERENGKARISIQGKLVPASSNDPLAERFFDISGQIEALIDGN